jgi:hypothetical protein
MKFEISHFWADLRRDIKFSILMRDWCMWFSNGYQHVIQGGKGGYDLFTEECP